MTSTLSMRRRFGAVLLGGFFGTIARYLLGIAIQGWAGKNFPYDILLINVTGALLLAFLTTLADDTFLIGPTRRLFLNVGFLGAYTTFSSLALGDVLLFTKGQWLLALLYLVLSLMGGVFAIWLGDMAGQWFLRRVKRRTIRVRVKTTRQLTNTLPALPADGAANASHIDTQDDLLLLDSRGDIHDALET